MLGWNESGSLKVNPSLTVQIYEHFLNPPNFLKKIMHISSKKVLVATDDSLQQTQNDK